MTAKNPATGDQVTRYLYGTTLADSAVARSDLLRAEIYPDCDDTPDPLAHGADVVYDRVEYRYNRQGEVAQKRDQNGTVHAYAYDRLGRRIHDQVTAVGSGVDPAVRRISTTYEIRGMVEKVTSYDSPTVGAGSVVNEVAFEYDDTGRLVREYQEHAGAKDAATLSVGYTYDPSADAGEFTKGLRPTSVRYPNGRLVHFTYGPPDGTNDALDRLAAIHDDHQGVPGDTLAAYSYLGLRTIVVEDYVSPQVKLDYTGEGSYRGFDRFGRIVDQRWIAYGQTPEVVLDHYTYGYDRASSRLYRENTTASGKDEVYRYDRLNQLTSFDRGELNAEKTAILGTPSREEDWTLDMTGNWSAFVQKSSGSSDLDQERTHNAVNEVREIAATTGTDWADPVHDRAGNMTTVPKPSSLANGLALRYDAWNRLMEVSDGATVIGTYAYDGLNRRITKHFDSQSPENPSGIDRCEHLYYSSVWQILETRETTTAADPPEGLAPKQQYVWWPRYLDAPILGDENTDQSPLCDDVRLYYLSDANFNVTCLITPGGEAVERYLYAPYDQVTIYDGVWAAIRPRSSYAVRHLYTGRERDAETRLSSYRARFFHAELGRFLTRDPIGYKDGINLFRYVDNSRLTRTDPTGQGWKCWAAVLAAELSFGSVIVACGAALFPDVVGEPIEWPACAVALTATFAAMAAAFATCHDDCVAQKKLEEMQEQIKELKEKLGG